jgi:hypothetical protein
MSFKIIRNAKVEAKIKIDNRTPILTIIINDNYIHTFKKTAKENNLIIAMDHRQISKKFSGGTYVFFDEKLIDYRSGDYRGFIHTEDGVKNLAEKVGFSTINKKRYGSGVRGLFNKFRSSDNGAFFGGEGSEFELDIAELGEGGSFRNRLVHKWSPFTSNIITSLEVERLICENGMVGLSPFVTNAVPLINDWERNLNIASTQLKPHYNQILKDRFKEMGNNRASVYDVMKAHEIIKRRSVDFDSENIQMISEDLEILRELQEVTNVEQRLGKFYEPTTFVNKNEAKLAVSDFTQYDVFNILTEACSHTLGHIDNDSEAQSQINRIVFDELANKIDIRPNIPVSKDSDHRRVFFGQN